MKFHAFHPQPTTSPPLTRSKESFFILITPTTPLLCAHLQIPQDIRNQYSQKHAEIAPKKDLRIRIKSEKILASAASSQLLFVRHIGEAWWPHHNLCSRLRCLHQIWR
jgi:hypothetical protein